MYFILRAICWISESGLKFSIHKALVAIRNLLAAATLGDLTELFPINLLKLTHLKNASAAKFCTVLTEF